MGGRIDHWWSWRRTDCDRRIRKLPNIRILKK
jgi:hypothetical protein